MNDFTPQQLLDAALRRPLTDAEAAQLHAWFAAHPQQRAAWEEELALNQLLQQLPDAPLSSNFTSCVLAAVDRTEPATSPKIFSTGWRRLTQWHWLRPVAFAAVVLGVGLVAWEQQRRHARMEVANSLKLPSLMRLPNVEMLKDFDAINSLSNTRNGGADIELLAVLERDK